MRRTKNKASALRYLGDRRPTLLGRRRYAQDWHLSNSIENKDNAAPQRGCAGDGPLRIALTSVSSAAKFGSIVPADEKTNLDRRLILAPYPRL